MDFNVAVTFMAPEAYQTAIPRVTTGVCELLGEQCLAPCSPSSVSSALMTLILPLPLPLPLSFSPVPEKQEVHPDGGPAGSDVTAVPPAAAGEDSGARVGDR